MKIRKWIKDIALLIAVFIASFYIYNNILLREDLSISKTKYEVSQKVNSKAQKEGNIELKKLKTKNVNLETKYKKLEESKVKVITKKEIEKEIEFITVSVERLRLTLEKGELNLSMKNIYKGESRIKSVMLNKSLSENVKAGEYIKALERKKSLFTLTAGVFVNSSGKVSLGIGFGINLKSF